MEYADWLKEVDDEVRRIIAVGVDTLGTTLMPYWVDNYNPIQTAHIALYEDGFPEELIHNDLEGD